MRAWLAGLFVFGGMILFIALLGEWMDRISPFIFGPIMVVYILLLCLVALVIFNLDFTKPQASGDYVQRIQAWEELGLITTTEFHATRAFEVAEFEDEGLHYFLELDDGSVLYLNGQYLYYVNTSEDSQEQEPSFPCTHFTIKHHQDGWVVALIPRGQPLHCELLDHCTFWASSYSTTADQLPYDGEIITDWTYDQLKNAE